MRLFNPKEYKVVALRECPIPAEMRICETPDQAARYWREHITTNPYFDPQVESFWAFLLTTRRRIKGHVLIAIGTLDTVLVDPRSVFRPAIVSSSAALILAHGHPSGDPAPSEADIKVTRDLIRAGRLLKIDVLDHIIMGEPSPERRRDHCSLRDLGYFFDA